MTNAELELLKKSDALDLQAATYKTTEKVINYLSDIYDINIEDRDAAVILNLVAQAVMCGYKTGADTGEVIAKDVSQPGEIIDVEFTVIEVV